MVTCYKVCNRTKDQKQLSDEPSACGPSQTHNKSLNIIRSLVSGQLAPWTIHPRQLAPNLQTTNPCSFTHYWAKQAAKYMNPRLNTGQIYSLFFYPLPRLKIGGELSEANCPGGGLSDPWHYKWSPPYNLTLLINRHFHQQTPAVDGASLSHIHLVVSGYIFPLWETTLHNSIRHSFRHLQIPPSNRPSTANPCVFRYTLWCQRPCKITP